MSDRADWLDYLSQTRAQAGDPLLALNTQMSADILRMEETIANLGEKVSVTVFDFSLAPAPLIDSAREVHDAFRENLLDSVTEGARAAVEGAWAPIDHLVPLRTPTSADLIEHRRRILGGLSPRDFRTVKTEYARQADALSNAFVGAGMMREAFRAAYRSDLAWYEAFLVDLAQNTGDHECLSVSVRLELAKTVLGSTDGRDDLGTFRESIRKAFTWAAVAREPLTWHS